MTQEKIIDAITELDSDILERYFAVKADLAAKKKPKKIAWVKWASLAACLGLVFVYSAIISGNIYTDPSFSGESAMNMAVIHYGPFIFIPILLISLINLSVSFTTRTIKPMFIVNAISLVAINILNVLGVYLYSDLGGINITGELPNILTAFNIGAIFFIVTHTLLDRKTKTWWGKLLLWTLISVISIVLACMAQNILLTLFQGNITIA